MSVQIPTNDDADLAEAEIDPFAEADALAALSREEFYKQLRAQIEKVKIGRTSRRCRGHAAIAKAAAALEAIQEKGSLRASILALAASP